VSPYKQITAQLIASRQDNAKLEQDNAKLEQDNAR
jgi:hypothetical protein